jgi:hypothetical protein
MSPSSGPQPRNRRATATSALGEKIREMQGFFSLKQTGRLDLQTLSVMRKHRCGVPDMENYSFYPDQIKWKNSTITYRCILLSVICLVSVVGHNVFFFADNCLPSVLSILLYHFFLNPPPLPHRMPLVSSQAVIVNYNLFLIDLTGKNKDKINTLHLLGFALLIFKISVRIYILLPKTDFQIV